ncbi:MAG: response regulator [Rheinheimera sp.]|nr:MAG: response regulator [Rheinheimera sp.]
MADKPVVLFIDDDSFMLKALLRAALRLRPDWQYFLCEDAQHWPSALPAGVVPDLVISDFLMPDINGDMVLSQVMAVYPQSVRVLMTGDTTEEVVSSVSVQAHFVLSKPFSEHDLLDLCSCIDRLRMLHVPEGLRRKLGTGENLPVLPAVIRQLRQALTAAEPDFSQIVDLIAHEPVIAARLMQLANSAFLGYSRSTHSLSEALMRLGLRLVEAIVTLMAVEQSVGSQQQGSEHRQLSERAFRLAGTVRQLAQAASLSAEQQDLLYVSALLSALGPLSKLQLLACGGPAVPASINGIASDSVMTVYLLTLWGYPAELCELELAMCSQGQTPDPADLRPFILFIARQYQLHCSRDYLLQMAKLVAHPDLQQALKQLPPLNGHNAG